MLSHVRELRERQGWSQGELVARLFGKRIEQVFIDDDAAR